MFKLAKIKKLEAALRELLEAAEFKRDLMEGRLELMRISSQETGTFSDVDLKLVETELNFLNKEIAMMKEALS